MLLVGVLGMPAASLVAPRPPLTPPASGRGNESAVTPLPLAGGAGGGPAAKAHLSRKNPAGSLQRGPLLLARTAQTSACILPVLLDGVGRFAAFGDQVVARVLVRAVRLALHAGEGVVANGGFRPLRQFGPALLFGGVGGDDRLLDRKSVV